MAYIDTKHLFKCETCRSMRSGECNTFCECGEGYTPDMTKIPTADVAEVKHGKWIERQYEMEIYYQCSACGCNDYGDSPYCPYCGAKMDGGKK